jgi:hypothetical protein
MSEQPAQRRVPKASEIASTPKQGEVCHCGRDYLHLTLEESLEPCPCIKRVRVWGPWRDDEEDDDGDGAVDGPGL